MESHQIGTCPGKPWTRLLWRSSTNKPTHDPRLSPPNLFYCRPSILLSLNSSKSVCLFFLSSVLHSAARVLVNRSVDSVPATVVTSSKETFHPYSTVSFPPLGLSFPCIVRRLEILSRHSIDVQDLISYLVGTTCLVELELLTQAHLHTLRTQGLTSLVIHASSYQPDDSRAIHPESSDSWLLLLTRPLRPRCPCRPKTVALFPSAIAIPSKT